MSKRSGTKPETIQSAYFTWRLRQRNGLYYADGRGNNEMNLGRHSLATDDHDEALENLRRLDHIKAVGMGLADEIDTPHRMLAIAEGTAQFLEVVGRSSVAGGSHKAQQRYCPVMDKFSGFCAGRGVRYWQHVNAKVLNDYLVWLEEQDYAYASLYLEGTVIKQAVKALEEVLGVKGLQKLNVKLRKPDESTAYCFSTREVRAILQRLGEDPDLRWLYVVIFCLAHTGLRISEVAALRWDDIDFDAGVITVPDESRHGTRAQRQRGRSTKGRRSREFPLHSNLRQVLEGIDRCDDGRVFHGPRGSTLKPDVVRRNLIEHAIRPLKPSFPGRGAGKSFKDGRLHSFRHYFCSMCADNGTSEQQLMAWLGHKDSKMVKRYYHPDRQRAAEQMNKIDFLGGDASAA